MPTRRDSLSARTQALTLLDDLETTLPVSADPRPGAAAHGALSAGLPAMVAAGTALIFGPTLLTGLSGLLSMLLPAFLAQTLAETALVGAALVMALPIGITASRLARRVGRIDREQGLAAAAGAGAATTLIGVGAVCLHASNLAAMASMGTGLMAALGAAALVGWMGFRSVPTLRRRGESAVPALYQGFAAMGVSALALLLVGGLVDQLSLALPFLDAPRALVYAALPYPFNDLGSLAMVIGLLAPVSYLSTRAMRRLMPDARPGVLAAGVSMTALSTVLSCLALTVAYLGAHPAWAANHLALAVGASLGAVPHVLAAALACRGEARSSRPELPAGPPQAS